MGMTATLIVILASVVMIQTQSLNSEFKTSSTIESNSTIRWATQEVAVNTTTDAYSKAVRETLKRFAIATVPNPTPCTNSDTSIKVYESLLPTVLILYLTFYLTV